MAISATYLQLQQQIAMELGDKTQLLPSAAGIWSPIKNAIQSAIAKWEREPFYFTEFFDTSFFLTVVGQEFYTVADTPKISTLVNLIRLQAVLSGDRYSLIRRPWQYLEDISVSSTDQGKPTQFAYFAERIRLFPIPEAIHTIRASGTNRLTAIAADVDANAWTQDGFDLIKAEAKLTLASEYLHDQALVAAMSAAIYGDPGDPRRKGYLQALREETERRAMPDGTRTPGSAPSR